MGRGLKPQMKYANKIGARYTMVLGESEVAAGSAKLKRMSDGEECEISLTALQRDGLAAAEKQFA